MNFTEYKNTLPDMKTLITAAVKGLLVIAFAFALIFGANSLMQAFLDDELDLVKQSAEKSAADIAALGDDAASAERTKRLKLIAQEKFYQQYKNRDDYHYYGQFYEMYEQVENADVLFLGTSHAAHGVNPLYVEQENPEYSFFNFALNGSNPQYYLDWYRVFKESGYPIPRMIVFCTDWFMCDDGWLWRRMDFDDSPDKPIDIMRRLRIAEKMPDKTSDFEEKAVEENKIEEKIDWWDADAIMTKVFSRIPLIFSRDRIPEMVRWCFEIKSAQDSQTSENEQNSMLYDTEGNVFDENGDVIMPKYTHSYLTDSIGNVTSSYYKGFIPWEADYDGSQKEQPCTINNAQKDAFVKLINQFMDDGIELLFVEVPEYVEGRRTDQFENNNKWIKKIADRYGITFLNYNDELYSEINDDFRNYSDWGHMNTAGSEKFSKILAKDIRPYLP